MRHYFIGLALLCYASILSAQTVIVVRNVNLRPDPTSEYAPLRLLDRSEPPLTLLDPALESGYYWVRTAAGEEGYVWARNVRVAVTTALPARPDSLPLSVAAAAAAIQPGPGIPGSAAMLGCGDSLWQHVYHPTRLIVKLDCVTVTGVIVDATANQSRHRADGVRHERDGDTHGWLKVDSQFANLINDGNVSDEEGNLVFELVCHYSVTQEDAQPACAGFTDQTRIPPVGTHVAITGTFVQEKNHKKWNEIHPVTRIVVLPDP